MREMAADRPAEGLLAAAAGGGVPGLLGLLLAMEAGVPVPVPSDLVMLLLGERVSAGALPLWLAAAALEVVALAGTAALFLAARELLEQAWLPVLVLATAVLVAVAVLLARRRRGRSADVVAEGSCPACLPLGLWTTRAAGSGDRLG